MIDRRALLTGAGASLLSGCGRRDAAVTDPAAADTAVLPFARGERPLVQLPGKRPLLQLTARPPQLETPFRVFDEGLLTPNDAFFVRYSMAVLPLDLDPAAWRLQVAGHVRQPLSLSLAALQAMPQVELVAVNQCSGNSRGFVTPRVGGGQLGHGAMGNARWTGVALRTLLDRAGVRGGAVEVAFDGLDSPASPRSPDFAKSLGIDHARDGEVMLAWAMNGAPLPFMNGFPLRLVVPGWFGTYWVKHLERITVLPRAFDGHFMAGTYRMPDNECGCVPPGTRAEATRPIARLRVRSFLTSHADGARVPAGAIELRGIAFDGGSGIRRVLVSTDGGGGWAEARLLPGDDRYGFRGWRHGATLGAGAHRLLVRAEAMDGQWQPMQSSWNPSGYASNGVLATRLVVA